MVYQSLTDPHSPSKTPVQIAPVSDRFLAFVFDLVIFTPVFSFILSRIFRQIELMYFVSPQSVEFLILVAVSILFISILAVLFQSLFLVWMGATPGKYFFKVKVVSIEKPERRLRFSQALLRSGLWMLEFYLLALPWLEVLSESQRRPLHDRAAGTMVTTRKLQGDPGPHSLETQFVRQLLVVSSLLALTWAIFAVGHFYKIAVRGDFKKSELESEEYLCSSVTAAMEGEENRIDKAIALFLADEISENCLASEADFVLWTPSETEKSWAYLAKGLINKYDSDQFEAYLQKACDQDATGVACQLAEFEANPKSKVLPEDSLSARILRVTQDFELGKYSQTEKDFVEISRLRGFENFARQGIVKSLWAQNKIEKSKGAYLNIVHQMSRSPKMELAAWICHEELDRSCTQEVVEACEDLKNEVQETQSSIQDSFVALALIREKECRQTSQIDDSLFQGLFESRKDLLAYVKAISRGSVWTQEKKMATLKDLAFRKESVRPSFLRLAAVQSWVKQARTEADLELAVHFLKEKKVKDLSWVKIYQKTLENLLQVKAEKLVQEVVSLPPRDLIEKFHLEESQVRAHFLAKEFEKASRELQFLHRQNGRAPASSEEVSFTEIEKALKARNSK